MNEHRDITDPEFIAEEYLKSFKSAWYDTEYGNYQDRPDRTCGLEVCGLAPGVHDVIKIDDERNIYIHPNIRCNIPQVGKVVLKFDTYLHVTTTISDKTIFENDLERFLRMQVEPGGRALRDGYQEHYPNNFVVFAKLDPLLERNDYSKSFTVTERNFSLRIVTHPTLEDGLRITAETLSACVSRA